MTGKQTYKIGVIGASGYTGADLIRLASCHPNVQITMLTGKSHAGKALGEVFPHLATVGLPDLIDAEDADFDSLDAVFCGLPHGASHDLIKTLPDKLKVIDMSADFRLRDAADYAKWYGAEHSAQDLLTSAVYGLTEHYREEVKNARLVACPGCYPTAVLSALLPLVKSQLIVADDIIVDAKSGVSGAGRALKQNTLFSEAGEGLSPYAVGSHRHVAELEQEIGRAAGKRVTVNFTPHLIPMSRGELVTCYVKCTEDNKVADLRNALQQAYAGEPFIKVVPKGVIPATQNVRGSNFCTIGIFEDRIPGRAIVIGALDNLVKGSAGQALQNFNLMVGLPETTGLTQLPMFP